MKCEFIYGFDRNFIITYNGILFKLKNSKLLFYIPGSKLKTKI